MRLRLSSSVRPPHLDGDIAGGVTGGLASVASFIPMGLVAVAPLGAELTTDGMMAVFTGAIVSGAMFTMTRRTPGLDVGTTMRIALVVAGVLGALVGEGVLKPGPEGAGALLAVVILLTLLSAIVTAAMGLSGLGRLVPLIPYPVISGMVNGGALLTIMTQCRAAIGLETGHGWTWVHPGMLLVSAATFALMTIPIPALRRVPSVLIALFGGSAVHYLLVLLASARFVGPLLGPVPDGLQQWHILAAGWAALPGLPLSRLLPALVPAALSIAVMTTLDTLLAASAMQDVRGVHRSAEPDLRAIAAANLVGGILGAMPVTGGSNPSLAVWNAGGRTGLASAIRLGVLLAVVLLLPAPMARLPLAVVAGIVIAGAWQLFDRDSLSLARRGWRISPQRRREMHGNLIIMLVVAATAVSFGMTEAVLAGGLLALVLFVVAMADTVVRRRYDGSFGRSRTYRGEHETDILLAGGGLIAVVELQGAVFFGSANQVAREVEAAVASGARHVIIDIWRVTSIDVSGARRLLQIADRFWRGGTDLVFAAIRPGTAAWSCLQDFGLLDRLPLERRFAAIEEAIEYAERRILSEAAAALDEPADRGAEVGLAAIGLPAALAASLASRLPRTEFAAGAVLMRAGEISDVFFVLIKGTVDVMSHVQIAAGTRNEARHQMRVTTLMPGLMVGEMGYLSGATRSADVVARTAATCLRVDAGAIETLSRTHPDLAFHLMRAIAVQLERKLRVTTAALVATEE